MSQIFDYVIVGGGSAGLLLADRLSEDRRFTVCVVEAGPPDRHPLLHVPAGFIKMLFNPAYTWTFRMEPHAAVAARALTAFQGKTLGGTSSINGMIYNRGQRADYDAWARAGNRGWAYRDILPYFKRTETRLGIRDEIFRGGNGRLNVTDNDWFHPVCEAFIAGAVAAGLPRNADYNARSHDGVFYAQRMIHRGRRCSAARAFLRPAKSRGNLEIRTECHAVALSFDGSRATGVHYLHGAARRTVQARREVILCCGAINTPRLLQLSGIGQASHLRELGIQVHHDLPGVGENFRDHYTVRMVARVRNAVTLNELARGSRLGLEIARWLLGRPSILGLSTSLVMIHGRSSDTLAASDIRGVFSPGSYKDGFVAMLDDQPGMTCGFLQHRPESAGRVRIRSADPLLPPLVDANYLASPADRSALIGGLRLGRRILHAPELAHYFESETLPGPRVQTDDEWQDFAARYGNPANHFVGSARMGPATDPGAVVDDALRVHGVQGLRIVDASVMPGIPSANTCAPTYMIAEKAADMILGLPPLPPIADLPAESHHNGSGHS